MRNLSRTALQTAALLLVVSHLSGCLLVRVYAFKEQFCDYQRNFTLTVDDGVTMQLHDPVLLDSDVIWLVGADPTHRLQHVDRPGQIEMVYVVEKDRPEPDPQYAIPLRLRFDRQQGGYRLTAGSIDKNLSAMITPGLIEETVAHTCTSRSSVLRRNVAFDLSGLNRADIPTRSEITDALGPPQQSLRDGRVIVYRFRLQGAGPEVAKSFARVWFGADGEQVERVRFRYLRYELDADFVAGSGTIAVHL